MKIKGAARTWREDLEARGLEVRNGQAYECPTCDRKSFAVEIIEVTPGDWQCGACTEPPLPSGPPDLTWQDVRGVRAVFLQSTDWTQLPDVPEGTTSAYEPLRLRARNVTDLPTIEEALAELAALQDAAAEL